ncbi:glycoside hydrolase superfamily [Protomyces lactucae-debilis]|uniref:glucan endo-1,6-beta-glucosidase n=1 Tax=Protomyces lactucae-debilis TaxID=2754530 RepID=A0A1Y2FR32_PROLT|nr:glycoside hydrolase superfamily [Protomyces lactucae-debilis]ORY86389.1 glycoside hydrolase superfamily [Protomyces lactucae-debilis]
MQYLIVASLFAALTLASPSPDPFNKHNPDVLADTGTRPTGTMHGVNLGSWLLTEPYMVPSLYEDPELAGWHFGTDGKVVFSKNVPKDAKPAIIDEYTLWSVLGHDKALKLLEKHWDTWYTEDDFHKFSAAGLNTVRLPIGYWTVNPIASDPYGMGMEAAFYVDKALEWASKANLKVIIDLHAAYKSQNGFDNSARAGVAGWGDAESVKHTLQTLELIVKKWGSHSSVYGIAVLNEPASFLISSKIIDDFHKKAIEVVRPLGKDIYISDSFRPYAETAKLFGASKAKYSEHVVLDTHLYQVFSDGENSITHDHHLNWTCGDRRKEVAAGFAKMNLIVGELSGAQTDCAKYLNGFKKGSRYDGTFNNTKPMGDCKDKQSLKTMSDTAKQEVKEFIGAQLDAYSSSSIGWLFWAGKAEATADLWSFEALYDAKLFDFKGSKGFCDKYNAGKKPMEIPGDTAGPSTQK